MNSSTSSDDKVDDHTDDDNDKDRHSDEVFPDVEEDTTSSRKRKYEFSTFDETSSKKRDTSVLRGLPMGDLVTHLYYYDVNL